MIRTISRRDVMATLGLSAVAGAMHGQSLPVRSVKDDYKEDFFYREDGLGEPWRKPEPVVLIHGNDESSTEWYAWVPRMAQEYRLIRPDLPGLGHSTIPPGFEYSLANLATFVTKVMDRAGVDSAHIIGAKTGGAVAMRFAADYPKRTRTLVVVGAPAATFKVADPSPIPQRDRLGSNYPGDSVIVKTLDGSFSYQQAQGSYRYNLDARDLVAGSYVLVFSVTGDQILHSVPVNIR